MVTTMNKSHDIDRELGKLKTAQKLFSELLLDKADYPSDVKLQLEKDWDECDAKIKDLTSQTIKSKNKQAIYTDKEAINFLEIDYSYFITKYQVEFYNGEEGKKGKLIFDRKHSVSLGGVENDICLMLFNRLKKTWETSLAKDIGWVSYDEFRESVCKWKEKLKKNRDAVVVDQRIISAIDRINKKIKKSLYPDCNFDMIENGQPFNWEKHYRFRINTGYLSMPD